MKVVLKTIGTPENIFGFPWQVKSAVWTNGGMTSRLKNLLQLLSPVLLMMVQEEMVQEVVQ